MPVASDAQRINLVVHINADILSPLSARRRANGWLLDNVGNLLHSESPQLVAGDRILWRVQVVLTSPSRGSVGVIGALDLDAITGEVIADGAIIDLLHQHAAQIAQC